MGGLLLLAVLAGCSAAGSLTMQQVNDVELAEEASRSTSLPEEGPVREERLAKRAIENGSTTAQGRDPPVESGLPFAHGGRYYNLSWTVTDREEATAVDVAIDYNGSATSGEAVAYESLTARDRAVLEQLLPPRTDHRTDGYDFGVGATYTRTQANRSVLLDGEHDAVGYEGETYPVEVDDSRTVTVRTYRYTATVVANSSSEYAEQLREEHLFTLSGLSQDERQVVEEAIDDRYYAEDTDDVAFRSVLERFRGHEAIAEDEYEGLWVVGYDGEVYVAELSYGEFERE